MPRRTHAPSVRDQAVHDRLRDRTPAKRRRDLCPEPSTWAFVFRSEPQQQQQRCEGRAA